MFIWKFVNSRVISLCRIRALMIFCQQAMLMKHISEIHEILRSGKRLNLEIHHGQLRGVMVDQDGTLNVQRWRMLI